MTLRLHGLIWVLVLLLVLVLVLVPVCTALYVGYAIDNVTAKRRRLTEREREEERLEILLHVLPYYITNCFVF